MSTGDVPKTSGIYCVTKYLYVGLYSALYHFDKKKELKVFFHSYITLYRTLLSTVGGYSCAREMAVKSEGWGLVQGQISSLLKTYQSL